MSEVNGRASSATAIILIGMPGVGKSTLAQPLSRALGWPAVDTDELLVHSQRRTLQAIVDADGYQRLRQIEEAVILANDFSRQVVATGGSAVFSAPAMRHLQRYGPLVFLDLPLAELSHRISNFAERGIAAAPGTSLEEVFAERAALYRRWADIRIEVSGLSEEALCQTVLAATGHGGVT